MENIVNCVNGINGVDCVTDGGLELTNVNHVLKKCPHNLSLAVSKKTYHTLTHYCQEETDEAWLRRKMSNFITENFQEVDAVCGDFLKTQSLTMGLFQDMVISAVFPCNEAGFYVASRVLNRHICVLLKGGLWWSTSTSEDHTPDHIHLMFIGSRTYVEIAPKPADEEITTEGNTVKPIEETIGQETSKDEKTVEGNGQENIEVTKLQRADTEPLRVEEETADKTDIIDKPTELVNLARADTVPVKEEEEVNPKSDERSAPIKLKKTARIPAKQSGTKRKAKSDHNNGNDIPVKDRDANNKKKKSRVSKIKPKDRVTKIKPSAPVLRSTRSTSHAVTTRDSVSKRTRSGGLHKVADNVKRKYGSGRRMSGEREATNPAVKGGQRGSLSGKPHGCPKGTSKDNEQIERGRPLKRVSRELAKSSTSRKGTRGRQKKIVIEPKKEMEQKKELGEEPLAKRTRSSSGQSPAKSSSAERLPAKAGTSKTLSKGTSSARTRGGKSNNDDEDDEEYDDDDEDTTYYPDDDQGDDQIDEEEEEAGKSREGKPKGKKAVGSLEIQNYGIRRRKPKQFKCRECGTFYDSVKELNEHKRDKHFQVHQCSRCQKTYETEIGLAKHLLVHNETNMKHKCPECPQGFPYYSQLTRHLMVHSDERHYHCPSKTCIEAGGRHYKSRSEYLRHMESHKGDKHPCEICGVEKATKKLLTDHMRRVHGPPIQCDHVLNGCDFSSRSELQMKQHHAECPFKE